MDFESRFMALGTGVRWEECPRTVGGVLGGEQRLDEGRGGCLECGYGDR